MSCGEIPLWYFQVAVLSEVGKVLFQSFYTKLSF